MPKNRFFEQKFTKTNIYDKMVLNKIRKSEVILMLDAILFDLDGTILDTLSDLRDACNYAIVPFGYKPIEKEDVRKNIGDGILMLIKRCVNFNLENIEIMHQKFKE